MGKPPTSNTALMAREERTCLPVDIDTEDEDDHHGSKCYNVTMDFISLVLAVIEIGLVLYLSVEHFLHQMGIIALAMLAPLVLNFVGVTYFFSNKEERIEFERVGNSRCAKDLFQVPVLGPVFTSIKVLSISSGCSSSKNYARFEASAIKMKQAESFFGAAPEALVQLTVLLVTREENMTINNYLEIAVVVVSVLTLAEANMYGIISNYYKLFHDYDCGDWKLPHLTVWQKMLLLFHSITSIGSRIAAVSFLKSAIKYFFLGNITEQRNRMMQTQSATRHKRSTWDWPSETTVRTNWRTKSTSTMATLFSRGTTILQYNDNNDYNNDYYNNGYNTPRSTTTTTTSIPMTSAMGNGTAVAASAAAGHSSMASNTDANSLAFLVVAVMMGEMAVRMILFYIARLIKYNHIGKGIPSGCYESVNYGWRATILDFGYQSKNILVQIWFYVENIGFFVFWWLAVTMHADPWVRDEPFSPVSALFLLCTISSIFLLFACRGMELHDLKTPFNRSNSTTGK